MLDFIDCWRNFCRAHGGNILLFTVLPTPISCWRYAPKLIVWGFFGFPEYYLLKGYWKAPFLLCLIIILVDKLTPTTIYLRSVLDLANCPSYLLYVLDSHLCLSSLSLACFGQFFQNPFQIYYVSNGQTKK